MADAEKKPIAARPVFVTVEGPIGAGKTVLVEQIGEAARRAGLNVITILEPVSDWVDNSIHGPVVAGVDRPAGGFLQAFYADPVRWAFAFQMFVRNSRMEAIDRAFLAAEGPVDLVVLERSPMTDSIFMYLQKDKISPIEFETYRRCSTYYTRSLPFRIEDVKVLLIQPSIAVCMERLASRNRAGEAAGVSPEYQRQLVQAHLDYFLTSDSEMKRDGFCSPVPQSSVILMDAQVANKNFKDDSPERTEIIEDVLASLGFGGRPRA